VIEQATYSAPDSGGYEHLARSPGFLDNWLSAAKDLCAALGERRAGVACPGCVFAQQFGAGRVAVVQAADQADSLGFRLLILPAALYASLGGDPFYVADQFPPDWRARGELPALEWTAGPPPERTVEAVQKLLNAPHSAVLLGGVQALLDGGRLAFERAAPDPQLLRGLWALLPTGDRCEMWPASFAFSNGGQFHAVVVPDGAAMSFPGVIGEEEAADYPEGRYEWNLQRAAEAGDQRQIDALFGGRKQWGVLRLVFLLLVLLFLNLPFMLMFRPSPPAKAPMMRPAAEPEKPNLEKGGPRGR
jgi:hypothetical protein